MHQVIVAVAPAAEVAPQTVLGMTPAMAQVFGAIIAAFVAIGGLIWNSRLAIRLQQEKFEGDVHLASRKAEYDRGVQRYRVRAETAAALEKRKQDFAELALIGFYEVAADLRWVRAPASFLFENKEREGRDNEDPEVREARDTYWPTLKRLNETADRRAALHAMRFRARALFGKGADEPFQAVAAMFLRVEGSANILLRPAKGVDPIKAAAERLPWEAEIWEGFAPDDAVAAGMAKAIALAEEIFGPSLARSGRGSKLLAGLGADQPEDTDTE